VRRNAHRKLFHTKAEAAYVAKAMKTSWSKSAFTLIELLVVIFVVAILAALLLPALSGHHTHYGPSCMSNQKQIALGFVMFEGDNEEKFPWQLSITNGGAMERRLDGHPSGQFLAVWPYINNFSVFICPADTAKHAAVNTNTISDQNISYFLNVDATTSNPSATILSGDRYLEIQGKPINPGLFTCSTNVILNWAKGFHQNYSNKEPCGILSFADGHAQFVGSHDLLLQNQSFATNRLSIP
jgi:prepilin-type N-terminal cleavage/methylation domain-containing protein